MPDKLTGPVADDGRAPAAPILAAVGDGPASIDRIAERVGARSRRDALRLHRELLLLAGEGRVVSCGGGLWRLPGRGPTPPPSREPATGRDVLEHGFGVRDLPLSIPAIARNVERATGRDASGIATLLPAMAEGGILRMARRRCFVLAPETAASLPARDEGSPGRIQELRALRLMSVPVGRSDLAQALGVSRERARQVANALVERGEAVRMEPSPGSRTKAVLYRASAGAGGADSAAA
jgi:hypothetical protein